MCRFRVAEAEQKQNYEFIIITSRVHYSRFVEEGVRACAAGVEDWRSQGSTGETSCLLVSQRDNGFAARLLTVNHTIVR